MPSGLLLSLAPPAGFEPATLGLEVADSWFCHLRLRRSISAFDAKTSHIVP